MADTKTAVSRIAHVALPVELPTNLREVFTTTGEGPNWWKAPSIVFTIETL